MESFYLVVRFFQGGGEFMYPIALVMTIGVAIAIERFWFVSRQQRTNQQAFRQLMPLIQQQDFMALTKFLQKSTAPLTRVLGAAIRQLPKTRNRSDLENAMEESLLETLPRLEKRTAYLATLANVATLLGLLGTISGLIDAFNAVAQADPANKAALLSQSIAVAMNTTAFGLIVAIPLVLAHTYIHTKTTEVVDLLDMACSKCLNSLSSPST